MLREELRAGGRPVVELKDVATRLGMSWRTVERAKRELEVETEREGFGPDGRWFWKLSNKDRQSPRRPMEANVVADYENGPETQGGSGSGDAKGRQERDVAAYGEGDGEVLL